MYKFMKSRKSRQYSLLLTEKKLIWLRDVIENLRHHPAGTRKIINTLDNLIQNAKVNRQFPGTFPYKSWDEK